MTAIPHPEHSHAIDYAPHPAHPAAHDHAHGHEVGFVKKYVFSTDHKVIGLQFLFLGLVFFVVGGLEAMLVRWQLGWPGAPVPLIGEYMKATGAWNTTSMPPEFYGAAFTMHASIMIFFVIIPLLVGTFGNYLIPLKIGAPDMAFPFLNGVAFWSAFPAGALMASSFFLQGGPAQTGWTVYPPLSAIPLALGSVPYVAPENAWESFVMLFRVHDAGAGTMSSWPAMAILLNYLALFMCFLYVCAYAVRTRMRPLNWLVGIAVSAGLAFVAVKGFQRIAFDGQAAWFLSVFMLGFSSILGAVNYLATIIKLRCPGMTMFRMPLSIWSLFITSILVLLATPVLASVLLLNLLEHHQVASFFTPYNWNVSNTLSPKAGGGYPLLHQHLFWFYSHPAVYIMILPAMGMVSDVIAVFARKPIFGYRPMVYALTGIAFLGFIVWAHHMFQSGMNPTLGTTFAISTMFIAVPSAIKVFNWLGTLWGGNIRFTAAMLFAIAFVSQFVVGGLSGIFMASTAVDVHIHDTYFIVAHIHYVLFGSSIFGIFASLYFWYPKMFGRMADVRLLQPDVLPHAHPRHHRLPPAGGRLPPVHDLRRDLPADEPLHQRLGVHARPVPDPVRRHVHRLVVLGQARAAQPVAGHDARVGDREPAAPRQLRQDPRRPPRPLRVRQPAGGRRLARPNPMGRHDPGDRRGAGERETLTTGRREFRVQSSGNTRPNSEP
jgi:heme/copper-type cytochrome/quinol oxidase subunit 1